MIKATKTLVHFSAAYKVFFILLAMSLTGCATAPPSYPGHIDLSGARNFRDLGGYPTTDGAYQKRATLSFRSTFQTD